MQITYVPKSGDITHDWVLIDANGKNLGRLATQIANILLGKNKPTFTPGVDTGDYVVVLNVEGPSGKARRVKVRNVAVK